jgi:hypothetical protein
MSMPPITKSTEYAAMVAEAEASVSAVKDPELRRVAFEKILTMLLQGEQSKSPRKKRLPKPQRVSPAAGKVKHSSSATRHGPKGHIEALMVDGFFEQQRTIAEVKAELANQGHHIALTSLSGPLQKLTQERRLRRQKVGANGKGSKTAYAYSNW